MPKVLVTGFTSQAANPDRNKKGVLVSWLISQICRDLNYDVDHRNPRLEETYEEYDHVFVNLAPFHSLGTNRIYGALSAIIRTYDTGKLTLYLDDINTHNVVGGIKVFYDHPERMVKPFYRYRLEHNVASTGNWADWLQGGVELLQKYDWPPTLVPSFPWRDEKTLQSKARNLYHSAIFYDPTPYMPDYSSNFSDEVSRQWITESRPTESWLRTQYPTIDMRVFAPKFERRPDDRAMVTLLERSWGLADPGYPAGWWYPSIAYAAQAKSLYVTRWQNVQHLGLPYTLLMGAAEELTPSERRDYVEAQAKAFSSAIGTADEAKAVIRSRVEGK